MVSTRKQKSRKQQQEKETMEAIMKAVRNVIGNTNGHVVAFFESLGIESSDDLMIMTIDFEGFAELVNDPFDIDGTETSLNALEKKKVLMFAKWLNQSMDSSDDLDKALEALTMRDLINLSKQAPIATTTLTSSISTVPSQMQVNSSVHEFTKGIKKDPSQYEVLNKDDHWQSWKAHLTALAATHGVLDVLQPNYTPPSGEEAFFKARNDFVYSVFHSCLQSASTRKVVRMYEETRDAQIVDTELLEDFNANAHAKIKVRKLRKDLEDMQLNER